MATKALQQINGIALLDYTEGFIFRADDEDKAIYSLVDALLATTTESNAERIMYMLSQVPNYSIPTLFTASGLTEISKRVFTGNGGPDTIVPEFYNTLCYFAGKFLISKKIMANELICQLTDALIPSDAQNAAYALIPPEYQSQIVTADKFMATVQQNRFLLGILIILAFISPDNMVKLKTKLLKAVNS